MPVAIAYDIVLEKSTPMIGQKLTSVNSIIQTFKDSPIGNIFSDADLRSLIYQQAGVNPSTAPANVLWPENNAFGKQKAFMQLVANVTLAAQKNTNSGKINKVLHIDLKGSKVGPGNLIFNQDDKRAYFLDYIWVHIWCQRTLQEIHINNHEPDMVLSEESPNQAPDASGNISSSVSFQVEGSAGAFGDMPMGSLGAGGSISSSHSHSLMDFSFKSKSQGHLQHEYFMEQAGDGEPYDPARPAISLGNEFQSPLVGARLRPLPTLSISNVAVPSQAIFTTKADSELNNRRTWLFMQIDAQFSAVEGTNEGFSISTKQHQSVQSISKSIPIDLQDVSPKSE